MKAHRGLRPSLLTLTLTLATLFGLPAARASILTAGNFQGGTPTPTLTISAPITLTINFNSPVMELAFVSWVFNDGNNDAVLPSPSTQNVSYLLDGVPGALRLHGLVDNVVVNSGSSSIRVNDGVLQLDNALNVRVGQTLTLLPQTFTFDANPDFNPHVPAVFNGDVFLTGWGGRISDVVSAGAVPEPATWTLLVAGGLGVMVAAAGCRARQGHGV